jgi:hypothetical protein
LCYVDLVRLIAFLAILLTGSCASPPTVEKAAAPAKPQFPKPVDESKRFPKAGQLSVELIEPHLFAKDYLPGGNLASYQSGKLKYKLFLGKTASPTQAAIALGDWKNAMTSAKTSAKFLASFGGYFGQSDGMPIFVFTKNAYILGVAGLDQEAADAVAREFAARVY